MSVKFLYMLSQLLKNSGGGGSGGINSMCENLNGTLINLVDKNATNVRNYAMYNNRVLESVNLPNVIKLGDSSFKVCTSLTSLNLPKAKTFGPGTFSSCTNLKYVKLESAETFGDNTFSNCSNLAKVDLYAAKSTMSGTFNGCGNLETLIIRSGSVCTLYRDDVLQSTKISNGKGYIYVPSNLIEQYKTSWSTYAKQFRKIEDYPDICG